MYTSSSLASVIQGIHNGPLTFKDSISQNSRIVDINLEKVKNLYNLALKEQIGNLTLENQYIILKEILQNIKIIATAGLLVSFALRLNINPSLETANKIINNDNVATLEL